jgi:hypothetical protein
LPSSRTRPPGRPPRHHPPDTGSRLESDYPTLNPISHHHVGGG